MVSKFALLSNLLLASAALAVPSSSLEARLAHRRENRQLRPINRAESPAGAVSNIAYTTNWVGAVWAEADGIFNTVTGTFAVPTGPSGNDGTATAWVGIDGHTCTDAALQTGVDFTISGGVVSYNFVDFPGPISISPGDVIKTTVTAHSTTSGEAVIENLTTGQTVSQSLSSVFALCEQNAEWIVEDPLGDGGLLAPFADFGTVTFTSATASGPSGTTYTPSGATLVDIEQNGQLLSFVATAGESVKIQYF